MTLAMPDSTDVNALPPGYDAYLGYADGRWPTAKALRARFPSAEMVILTVNGSTPGAHGARVAPGTDVEPADLTAGAAMEWLLSSTPMGVRPVIYASTVGVSGYGMGDVLRVMAKEGISRDMIRLLSAHYGAGAHICGPSSCGEISIEMDGTQWANQAIGLNGAIIDMSMLAEDFFDRQQTETERLVTELGIVRPGQTGNAVRTVQGLLIARGAHLVVDGVFGPVTEAALKIVQDAGEIAIDGVAGPQTWPVLLGVAS